MRSSKSRSRSKSSRNRPSGGNVVNRVFDSSGPEGKVRGTPQQIIDKYNQLARDAQLANDRVAAENFQQHAEHYLRLLSEAQREIEAKREEQERQNRERQAERDRERAERQERESKGRATGGENSDKTEDGAPQAEESDGDKQPDVLAMAVADGGEEEPILVETPEDAPKKPARRTRSTRKPAASKAKPEDDDGAGQGGDDKAGSSPEAAE